MMVQIECIVSHVRIGLYVSHTLVFRWVMNIIIHNHIKIEL